MAPQPRRNWLEVEQIQDVTVAKFTTRTILTEEKLTILGRQLWKLGDQVGRGPLIINFAGIERLSTEMLGNLVVLQRRVQGQGGRMKLCGISPALLEIFKILRLTRVFRICDEEQEALQTV
jgi:anti-sigma B factor antagonist